MTSSAKRVPMIATARQCYEGRWLHSGEPFEVSSEEDAADLVALRFALRVNRVAPTTPASPPLATPEDPRPYERTDVPDHAGMVIQTKVMTPEEEERDRQKQKQGKNEYNRRDMRARK